MTHTSKRGDLSWTSESDRLRNRWREWEPRFQELTTRVEQRPEVAISLVGGVGAGKSTLLNALIGARVLPVSCMHHVRRQSVKWGLKKGRTGTDRVRAT